MAKVRTTSRKKTPQRRVTRPPSRSRAASPQTPTFTPALLAYALDLIHIIDATGTIRYVSPAVTRLLGYQPEDIQGHDSFQFVHPDDVSRLREATANILRQPGSAVRQEYRVRHTDGSWRSFEGVATNLLADPTVAGIVINSRDITDRTETAGLLHASEDRYRQLVDLLPNPVFIHADGQVRLVNAAAIRFFGAQSAEELIGKPVQELVPANMHVVQQQRIQQILGEGRATQFLEFPFLRLDGQTIHAEAAGAGIMYAGRPAVQTVLREMTTPRRDDQAIRAREERYRLLFDNANDLIAAFTLDGTITEVNTVVHNLLGWTPEELEGQHYSKVLTPAAHALAEERNRRYLAGEESMPSIFEIDLVRKDGTTVPVEARARPIRGREGEIVGFQGIFRDMTIRKLMEKVVQENRHLLERIADTVPEVVYLYEYPTLQTVYVNRQITQVLGYAPEQLHGTPGPFQPLLHPDDTAAFSEQQQHIATAADGMRIEAVYRVRHANGAYRWLQSRETVFRRTAEGQPAQIFGVAQDVTARQQARQLGRQQRVQLEELPARLKAFRERLGLTQTDFGQTFGGYSARQITSYERGQIEIPLKLLLAIHSQGYLLEAIFGTSADPLLDATIHYLTDSYPDRTLTLELAATVVRLLTRDHTMLARLLQTLGLPTKDVSTEQKRLLDQLAGIAPAQSGRTR